MDFLAQYGLFFAKTLTFVAAILVVLAALASAARDMRGQGSERLEIRNVNQRLREVADTLNSELLDDSEYKQLLKQRKQEDKQRRKAVKLGQPPRPRVFALNFEGDLAATAVGSLREEISAVLQVAGKDDEVLLRLQSEGGMVHAYGLAASQLVRLRQHGVRLTVAIDKVAASGGYLMACVADRILSAPFAVVGSIGVVAQLPNFHRLLQKHEIDVELHTAGEYKRTLTLFGENTDAGRAKFRQELEETHTLFKSFVAENRPSLDMAQVATGEHWYGATALALKLVDEIRTSDDYLLDRARSADIYELQYRQRQRLSERLAKGMAQLSQGLRDGAARVWS